MKKTDLVVKSNKLIEAGLKFTANEYKVISYLIGRIDIDIDKFEDIEIKLKDLNNKCFKNSNNTKSTSAYIKKKYAYGLAKKNITILKEDGNIKIYNWFNIVETTRNTIKVSFSPRLKEFLLTSEKVQKEIQTQGKKQGFTQYKLGNILNLDTFYEIRLYEIMKQYEKLGFREMNLKELRFMLGIEDKKVKRFTDFKEKILKKSIKNINEKTDIKIKFDFEKISSNNVEFKFSINGERTNRKPKELIEIQEKIENVVKREVNYNILERTIKKHNIQKGEIELYLKHWHKFDYKDKEDPVAFFLYNVANRRPIPEKEIGNKNNGNKPIQATNYEQRTYTEEFLDSLYDNF